MNLIQGAETIAGHIPELYETYLVPLISKPYAADLVQRVAATPIRSVLEGDAGTDMSFFRNFLAKWREPTLSSCPHIEQFGQITTKTQYRSRFRSRNCGISLPVSRNSDCLCRHGYRVERHCCHLADPGSAKLDSHNGYYARSHVSLNTSETCYAWLMCSYDSIEAALEACYG